MTRTPLYAEGPHNLSESLEALAAVLKGASETDSLALLGQLLDSVPVGVLVTDSSPSLRCEYVNAALKTLSESADKVPIIGRPLGDVWKHAEENGVLTILRKAAAFGQPRHLRDFDYFGVAGTRTKKPSDISVWDWGVYPLTKPAGRVTHLLVVGRKQRMAHTREIASTIVRIFGAEPDVDLTPRESEVADLIAEGLTNIQIAHRISVSPTTVATHAARTLQKLGFKSRGQVAVWATKRRLRSEA